MNGWTASLQAAQRGVSPVYSLDVQAAARSTGWQRGGGPWLARDAFPSGLAGWQSQSIAADAALGPAGVLRVFLSWWEGKLAVQQIPGAFLDQSATWSGAPVVIVANFTPAGTVAVRKPALVRAGGVWQLYYSLPDGNLYQRSSSDGATWSAAATVYGGGDVTGDLFAAYLPQDGLHVVHFATQSDAVRLRGASRKGAGGWSLWPLHGAALGWQPGGIAATGGRGVTLFAWARTTGPYAHHFAALPCTLNADGTLAARSAEPVRLWVVGGEGVVKPAAHGVGPGFGGWLHCCQEVSGGRAFACAGWIDPAALRLEEPAPLAADPLPAAPLERHAVALDAGMYALVVGLARVWLSVVDEGTLTGSGDDVIAYRCESLQNGEGRLDLRLRPGAALGFAHPGHGLWLTRRCTLGGDGGAATLGFRILRVERHAAQTRILAADALGQLAQSVARRPWQVQPDAFSPARAAELLCAWAGLGSVQTPALEGDAPLFQWQAGEEGLRALLRLLRAQAVTLRSRVSGAGERPLVEIAAPGTAPLYAYGAGAHPLIQRVQVEDARAPALAVAQGLLVPNLPAEGEEWALRAAAPLTPGVRPRPLVQQSPTLTGAALDALADGLAARMRRARPAGWIETQANLALEPHDVVLVEGEECHVLRVVERWERRRLVQRVELAAGLDGG